MSRITFPKGFLWGTATSSTQIETCGDNDWKNIRPSHGSGPILNKTIEHEKNLDEDIKIISNLGNAYRFSFAWEKLQSKPMGELSKVEIKRYRYFLQKLKKKNITLMATLHHFANPSWFIDLGGWSSKKSYLIFEDYAKKIEENFGDLIDYYITFNEPINYAAMSYVLGEFPPYKKFRIIKYRRILRMMSKAHGLIYHHLKNKNPNVKIGIAKGTLIFHPENLISIIPSKILENEYMNKGMRYFPDFDFIGINYYGRVPMTPLPVNEIFSQGKLDSMSRKHDLMWETYPAGIKLRIIEMFKKYRKPIIITENGTPTNDDNERIEYMKAHLEEIHKAIKSGVRVLGYFYWSAMDNYEWVCGIDDFPFGLYSVDKKMNRKAKPSSEFYRNVLKSNGLEINS